MPKSTLNSNPFLQPDTSCQYTYILYPFFMPLSKYYHIWPSCDRILCINVQKIRNISSLLWLFYRQSSLKLEIYSLRIGNVCIVSQHIIAILPCCINEFTAVIYLSIQTSVWRSSKVPICTSNYTVVLSIHTWYLVHCVAQIRIIGLVIIFGPWIPLQMGHFLWSSFSNAVHY